MKQYLNLFLAFMFLFTSLDSFGQTANTNLTGPRVSVGPKTSVNKDVVFNINKGAANPVLRANATSETLQFSNDGVNFTDIGSGVGGGGINMLLNPEFEKYVSSFTNWTASAGTVTKVTSGSDFSGFDKNSVTWTPAAAGNTFTSDAVTIFNGLKGAKGEESIYYKTSGTLHKLQLWDGSTVIKEVVLPATTNFQKYQIPNGFIFPTSGTLQLRLLAGDTTPIHFDKAYLGSYNSFQSSGAETQNFLANGDVESGSVTEWKCFAATGATTRPTNGMTFAGSPTVTMTASSTTPIRGSYSAIFTKTAVNSQAQGCYQDFKIEDGDLAKVLNISVEYKVNSGTFTAGTQSTDSDLIWYIYDVDTGTAIEPSSFKLLSNSTTLTDVFNGTFQTNITSKNYRLIAFVPVTTTSAYSLKLEGFKVERSKYVFGTPITDWVSYTPTGSWTTNTTYTGRWRRVGDSIEGIVKVLLGGAPNAANLSVNLPGGMSFDTTKLVDGASTNEATGPSSSGRVGSGGYSFYTVYLSTNSVLVAYQNTLAAAAIAVTNTQPVNWTTNDYLIVRYGGPISGWSSSVQMSDSADTRVVALSASSSLSTSLPSNTSVDYVFNIVNTDTHGAYNSTTGVYTVPVSGIYEIKAGLLTSQVSWGGSAGTFIGLEMAVNGVNTGRIGYKYVDAAILSRQYVYGAKTSYFKQGDTIKILALSTNTSSALGAASDSNLLSITRLSGPSAIAASESVFARYSTAAGQSIPNGTATVVNFDTKDEDSHNSVTTGSNWKFTAPINGIYRITPLISFAFTGFSSTSVQFEYSIWKNGTTAYGVDLRNAATTAAQYMSLKGSLEIRLKQGEYIDVRISQTNGGAANLGATSTYNHVSILKVAN